MAPFAPATAIGNPASNGATPTACGPPFGCNLRPWAQTSTIQLFPAPKSTSPNIASSTAPTTTSPIRFRSTSIGTATATLAKAPALATLGADSAPAFTPRHPLDGQLLFCLYR